MDGLLIFAVFVPSVAAGVVLLTVPRDSVNQAKWIALAATLTTLVCSAMLALAFDRNPGELQYADDSAQGGARIALSRQGVGGGTRGPPAGAGGAAGGGGGGGGWGGGGGGGAGGGGGRGGGGG